MLSVSVEGAMGVGCVSVEGAMGVGCMYMTCFCAVSSRGTMRSENCVSKGGPPQ